MERVSVPQDFIALLGENFHVPSVRTVRETVTGIRCLVPRVNLMDRSVCRNVPLVTEGIYVPGLEEQDLLFARLDMYALKSGYMVRNTVSQSFLCR